MKFSLNIGSGVNIDTVLGTAEGDSSGARSFKRSFPLFTSLSWEDLQVEMTGKGWTWSTSLESKVADPEPDPEPVVKTKSKKKGVFSKSKDDEEKVGD